MQVPFTATIIAAVVGTPIMGLWAKWSSTSNRNGTKCLFAFGVIFGMGYTYQQALAAVFIAGLVFIGLSVTPARKYIINSIPKSMKLGVGAGIGLFLAIIGLKNAGVVVDNPATLVGLEIFVGPTISRTRFCYTWRLLTNVVDQVQLLLVLLQPIIALIFGIREIRWCSW